MRDRCTDPPHQSFQETMMKDGEKVNINLIDTNPDYKERHTPWTEAMDSFLRGSFAKKGRAVRIIARKTGDRYVVIAGHHLLKAARACGLREVRVDVIDATTPPTEYLRHFTEIVADLFGKTTKAETFSQARAHA